MSVVRDYFARTVAYKSEYGPRTIVLMQVGSFFEVYGMRDLITKKITGSEIEDMAKICDLNIGSNHTKMEGVDIVLAGFKDAFIEKYVKKLQEQSYTVVVIEQQENKMTKEITRVLYAIYSPGTYFGDETTKITNVITCVWIHVVEKMGILSKSKSSNVAANPVKKIIYVGISNVDIYTGKSSIYEFDELYIHTPATFDQLERVMSINNPSETIMIGNISAKEMDDIVQFANIKSSLIRKISLAEGPDNSSKEYALNCEKQVYQRAILQKFYKTVEFDNFIFNFYRHSFATQSFCYLLDFIYRHNPNLVNNVSEPLFETSCDNLILANHSLKQLNIIEDNNHTGKYSSVAKMLNNAITPMGKRMFAHNLLHPTINVVTLKMEYEITEHAMRSKLFEKVREDDFSQSALTAPVVTIVTKLSDIKDISKYMRKMMIKKITPLDLYNLHHNLLTIQDICATISTNDIVLQKYFLEKNAEFVHIGEYCANVAGFLDTHFDLEQCSSVDYCKNFETNFIRRGINNSLDVNTQIEMESKDKLIACQKYLNGVAELTAKKAKVGSDCAPSLEYVKLNETEKSNFSLYATPKRCKDLIKMLPTVRNSTVELQYISSFNQTVCSFSFANSQSDITIAKYTGSNDYIESKQLTEICKNATTIKHQMKEMVNDVFTTIMTDFLEYLPMLEECVNYITLVDMIYAKSYIASKYNYCKPVIDTEATKSYVHAADLRHCLIEQLNQEELYVANDISLGAGVDGVLLYGTNAVGKTSFIKAIGISVIMAQAGLFVPASTFTYAPYKYLFTRIIGNDNIFKGLSTFAVEMTEFRTILRLTNEHSLILGDELCSGTESTSAISIFVAGIQQLTMKKSSFIFATHLHEIVKYDEIACLETVLLKHLTVVYDKERDALVYDRKLKDGPGQNMYGLEVCKSLGLPEDFLQAAYDIRIKYNPECGNMLSSNLSRYNSKKVKSVLCENCGVNIGEEVHHLQHQQHASENDMINQKGTPFHKNHAANLITLCEKCHNTFHDSKAQHKRVKTTKGTIIAKV